jgi:hypothetical protein
MVDAIDEVPLPFWRHPLSPTFYRIILSLVQCVAGPTIILGDSSRGKTVFFKRSHLHILLLPSHRRLTVDPTQTAIFSEF